MISRAALIIASLGASSIAGVVIATLVFAVEFRASSNGSLEAVRQGRSAVSICSIADASEPTFYSELAKVNAKMHEDMQLVPSGNVDHDFMRVMIPHHQGAIDMALALLKYGRDEKVRRLSQSIIIEQGQEIAYMRSLLGTPPNETSKSDHISHK